MTAQSEAHLTSDFDKTQMADARIVEEESKEKVNKRATNARGRLVGQGVIEEEEKGASDDPDSSKHETDFIRDKNDGNDDEDEEKVKGISGISPEEMNSYM